LSDQSGLLLVCLLSVGGIFKMVAALSYRFEAWGWPLVNGVSDVVLGVLIWSGALVDPDRSGVGTERQHLIMGPPASPQDPARARIARAFNAVEDVVYIGLGLVGAIPGPYLP
jgi:hypothetical protein